MKVFNMSCIDSKTRMGMLLSECTCEEAIAWLANKLGSKFTISEEGSLTRISFWNIGRRFFYDAERMYLMGE